jgi:hypothetical protein
MALKTAGYAGLGKDRGEAVRMWRAGNRGVWERSRVYVGPRQSVEEGAEVAEGSRDTGSRTNAQFQKHINRQFMTN